MGQSFLMCFLLLLHILCISYTHNLQMPISSYESKWNGDKDSFEIIWMQNSSDSCSYMNLIRKQLLVYKNKQWSKPWPDMVARHAKAYSLSIDRWRQDQGFTAIWTASWLTEASLGHESCLKTGEGSQSRQCSRN